MGVPGPAASGPAASDGGWADRAGAGSAPLPGLEPGDLPGVEILEILGSGPGAAVHRVGRNGHEYALTIGRPPGVDDAAAVAFLRETALLAGVSHPGLPRLHDAGLVRNRPYLVTDLVPGRSLTSVLAAGPLGVPETLALARDVVRALAAMHGAGVAHRELTPDAIVLDGSGRGRLRNLGLSFVGVDAGSPDDDVQILSYGSPERSGMSRRPVDARSDLYSLGVVLHECLTGRLPFTSTDVGELVRLHATAPVPDPRAARPELTSAVATIVATLLAKDPDDRYQCAEGLLLDLEQVVTQPDVTHLAPGARERPLARSEPVLAGRDREQETLRQRWRRAVRGQGGLVLVEGPSGSGKSRLVRDLLATVRDQGHPVLQGRCGPDDVVPLAPIRAAVDRYLTGFDEPSATGGSLVGDLVRSAAAGNAALLGMLSPRLAAALAPVGNPRNADRDPGQPAGDLSGGTGTAADGTEAPWNGVLDRMVPGMADPHDHFVDTVASFLIDLARCGGPSVLYLDDVQWLDARSLRVLCRMADELDDCPLLVVGTLRDDPGRRPGPGRGIREILEELMDTRVVTGPLDARAVGRILAGSDGGLGFDTGTAVHLATRTGGNALALQEYLESLVAAGLLRPSWGHWELDVVRAGEIPLAGSAVDLMARRIEGLSADTRRLLGVAAVLGTTFSADLVAQVSSTDLQRVLHAVAEARWARLLDPNLDGEHAFSHDCVREALLAQYTEGELRQRRQRVADDLEGPAASGPHAVFGAAWHSRHGDLARNRAQLYRTHRAAGILALREHAPEQAVEYLRQAADAGSTDGPVPDVDLHVALGIAAHHIGRYEDAVASYRQALEISRSPLERALIRYLVALVHDSTRNSPEEISAAEQGLAELGMGLPHNRLWLFVSSLGMGLLGILTGVFRVGRGGRVGRSTPRQERYRVITLLHALLAMGYVRELRPELVGAVCCRQLRYAGRAGLCPANVQTRAFLSVGPRALGLRRTASWISRGAARDARLLGNRQSQALVAWMIVQGALFGGCDGSRLRNLLHEHGRWLDPGLVLDALDALCWDALLHGDTDRAEEVFALRRRGVRTVRHGHDVIDGGTDRDGVTVEAGLEAMSGRPGAAMSRLALARVAPGRSRWRRLDLLVVTLQCAIEQGDPGEVLDRTIREFRATGLSRRQVFPSHLVLYAYQAYGRLEQCRTAPAEHRDDRLEQAAAAVAELGRVTARPLLAAHHRVAQAALLQLSGRNTEALAHLEGAAETLYRVESPLADFEAARIRARALSALGHRFEAEVQARCALLIASSQRWPHRARWVRSEFGTVEEAGTGGRRHPADEVPTPAHLGGSDGEVQIRLAALDQLSRSSVADVEGTADPEEVLRRLQDALAAAVECDRIWLVRPGDPGWSGVADIAVQDTPLTGDEEAAGAVVSRLPTGTDLVVRSWLAVPLRRGIRRIGVMLLASTEPDRFGPHQVSLAAAVVTQGLVAHDNAHLLDEVRRLVTIDDLTGIPNRCFLLDLADRRLSRARASGRPLVAIMIGIDGVKEINESAGQRVGDQVIRAVAQRLQSEMADDDVLGRYTGVELVLLSAVDEGVDAMAERLRRAVSDAPVATSVGPLGVTVSIGLVRVRSDDRDIGSVVRRADRNLNSARRTGRNRVCGDHPTGTGTAPGTGDR